MENEETKPVSPWGTTTRVRCETGWLNSIELPALRVIVVEGPDIHRDWVLTESVIDIGKAPGNHVILRDPLVSKKHARLRLTQEGVMLTDLESTNGTFVRGVRTRESFLDPDVSVTLGSTTLRVERRMRKIHAPAAERDRLGPMVGKSEVMRELFGLIEAVAPLAVPAIVTGPAGSGKDLVARTLHEVSGRRGHLKVVDCRQDGEDELEYLLFGTPMRRKDGGDPEPALFQAQGGTLVLDHLERLHRRVDQKLLRFLETKEVDDARTGKLQRLDVRLVVTGREEPDELVTRKRITSELYHRLAVVRIQLRPISDHLDDIPLMVTRFLEELACPCTFDESALAALAAAAWSENVRELRHVIERTAVTHKGGTVTGQDFDLKNASADATAPVAKLEDVERETILSALRRFNGNKVHTADALGISLSTLKRKLKEYEDADFEV